MQSTIALSERLTLRVLCGTDRCKSFLGRLYNKSAATARPGLCIVQRKRTRVNIKKTHLLSKRPNLHLKTCASLGIFIIIIKKILKYELVCLFSTRRIKFSKLSNILLEKFQCFVVNVYQSGIIGNFLKSYWNFFKIKIPIHIGLFTLNVFGFLIQSYIFKRFKFMFINLLLFSYKLFVCFMIILIIF